MQDLRNIQVYQSEIKLVIKGKGESFFLYKVFTPTPSEVIINGETKDPPANNKYNFDQDINYVTIKFNNVIESCQYMFNGLANVIEIDLSNFDASKVKDMYSMFLECLNLERINFGNIDTSSVNNMERLFGDCISLTSIDVSKFDTHNVENMHDMFANCTNLITVDISKFDTSKVKTLRGIFWHCYKLKFLDISSFDFFSISEMGYTFESDSSLVYIKFKDFYINFACDGHTRTFQDVSQNLRLCLDYLSDCYTIDELYKLNVKKDCSDTCFSNSNPKICLKTDSCVGSCKFCEYKYELNTLCYERCPETSYSSSDNEYLCFDKSPENGYYFDSVKLLYKECYNICKKCNTGGTETNHNCIECKSGFYLLDEPGNNGNCYKDPEGYYLDTGNNKYKKCYNSCKSCNKGGGETNHNCIECKSEFYFLDDPEKNGNCYKEPEGYYLDTENKIYRKCYNTCKSCDEGGSELNQNCNECISGLYFIDEPENDGNCYKDPEGYYLDTGNNIYKKCYNTCKSCNVGGTETNHNCAECIPGYYFLDEAENNNNCYKDPEGYYFDTDNDIYKKCYNTCKKCNMKGDNKTHNCLECDNNYPMGFKINEYFNCFQNCTYYYYFDNESNYYCTDYNTCPNEYPTLVKKECKKSKDNEIKGLINNINNDKNTKEEEINYYDTVLTNIEDYYTSKNFDTSNLDNGNDEAIEIGKAKVTFTTSENQKNNLDSDMTTIDLGDCEQSLRQTYNLTNGEKLYIKMLEISQEGYQIPKVEYDVYAKLDGKNLTKLSLDSCKNSKISLLIPVSKVDNIDKLNSSSGYYTDFCYVSSSDNGTDITLNDRKNEYTSKAVCQDDCDFVSYNYTTKKAKCSCKAKKSSSSFADMKIDKNKLLDNFKNLKNIANFKLLKCVKVLFSKIGISKNVGFYIFIFFIIFHTIVLILFYNKKLDTLIKKIKYLTFAIKYFNLKKAEEKCEKKEKGEKKEKLDEIIEIESKLKKNREVESNRIRFNEINDNNINNEKNEDDKKIKFKKKRKKKKKKKRNKAHKEEKIDDINKNDDNIININFINNIITDGNNKKQFENNFKIDDFTNLAAIIDYIDDEINDFSYDSSLKYDKRTYWQFYISLIKTKHELIYAFFYNKDYNSKIIKIDLFVFGFALNYAVNGLFFNDDTMHDVYENKGLFDVSYQLPLIVYSSFISMFLSALVQMLGMSNDAIIDFKQSEEINNINERAEKLIKKLKIKFVFYFILSYILLLFFGYYISMFDAVYRNTQYLLLEDTMMGFGLSLISPFLIYLLPGIFRISALAAPQQNKRCLYNFSKLFTIL